MQVHLIVNISEPIPGWGDPLLSSGGDVQNIAEYTWKQQGMGGGLDQDLTPPPFRQLSPLVGVGIRVVPEGEG